MATGLRLGYYHTNNETKISDFNKVREMAVSYGYILSQNNGQRIFGPPMYSNERRPDKACEIFIGNIPRDIFENRLIPMIMTCGQLYEFRLMLDFHGNNRGFAFALFYKKQFAENAIRLFNNYEMQAGRRLAVVQSIDNDRLYLGGFTNRTGENVIRTIYSHITNLTEVRLGVKLYEECHQIFVHFETHTNAAMARRCLLENSFEIWGCKITVDWAHRHEINMRVPTIVSAEEIALMFGNSSNSST